MGVQGLWDLASPAGQRVNLTALENKVVAVDASIWMYHFLKAMRDEKGDMVKGAHLIGFFRRICKLLYLKIRPVFVFDGAPPALKWKTLQLRAKQRESEERHRRKVVERLLRNQLQQHLLRAAGGLGADPPEAAEAPDAAPEVHAADDEEIIAEEAEEPQDHEDAIPVEPGTSRPVRRRRPNGVPMPFRGFMAQRRHVSEVQVPQLPAEPLREILQVPNRRAQGRMRQPDEWKGYAVPGGGIVTVPLDGPVALEEFEQLDPKTKYMLLQRAQEAWYGESRLKAVEAKDDMGAFVNVQLEMFLRHIRTNKEIEKVKRSMAESVARPVSEELAEGEVYQAPSFLQEPPARRDGPSEHGDAALGEAIEVDSVIGSKGSGKRGRGRGRGKRPRQLGGEPTRWQPLPGVQRSSDPMTWLAEEEVDEPEPDPPEATSHREAPEGMETAEELFGAAFFEEDLEANPSPDSTSKQAEAAVPKSTGIETADDLSGNAFFEDLEAKLTSQAAATAVPEAETETDDLCDVSAFEAVLQETNIEAEEVSSAEFCEVTQEAASVETTSMEAEELSGDAFVEAPDTTAPETTSMEAEELSGFFEAPDRTAPETTSMEAEELSGFFEAPGTTAPETSMEADELSGEAFLEATQAAPETTSMEAEELSGFFEAPDTTAPETTSMEAEELSSDAFFEAPEAPKTTRAEELLGDAFFEAPETTAPETTSMEAEERAGDAFCKDATPKEAPQRQDGKEATAAAVAAALAAPAAPAAPRPGGDDTSSLDGVWCSTHFQYRWRCKEDGVAHTCEAQSPPAETASKGAAKSRGKGRAGARDREEVTALGDEEMEELEFQRLAAELEDEHQDLRAQARHAKRGADMVTPEMQADVEALLEALGIPFVHAPAEAEAQCAFLAEARLVDAVASDDSDVLVFGAREVYRRMFSEDHQVECYSSARLEARLGLVQDQLIVLAMLLGCDYTLGVHGVGIVNGLEIVHAYSPSRGQAGTSAAQDWIHRLESFRSWAQNVANWGQESAGIEEQDGRAMAEFKRKHTNFRTQWSFPEDFPSAAVMSAFQRPEVDRSLEAFSWANVDVQRVVAKLNEANLSEEKVLERLDPALRRYQDTLRQPRITEYLLPATGDVAVVRSTRMQEALRGLRGEEPEETDEAAPVAKRARKGRGRGDTSRAAPRARRGTASRGRGRGGEAAATFSQLQSSGAASIDLDSDG